MKKFNFVFGGEKVRVDKFVSSKLNEDSVSRTFVDRLITEGKVKIDGKIVTKKSFTLGKDSVIEIEDFIVENDEKIDLIGQKMDLKIIYEDDYFLVINKESGIVVHPSIGHYNGTLLNGVVYHTSNKILELKESDDDIRPGVVHRLDKDTEGLIIFAKTKKTMVLFNEMIKERKIKKYYYALVKPKLEYDKGVIDAPIGRDPKNRKKMKITDFNSKESTTYFEVEKRSNDWELVRIELVTGRTHQIRVHFNFINHPVLNDPSYSSTKLGPKDYGQFLQANEIEFIHPITKKEMNFKLDLPSEFLKIINK